MSQMPEYPKIETAYNRDKTTFIVTDELRLPEIALIERWHCTEKIHGENCRIHFDGETVDFGKRTSKSDNIQGDLLKFLTETFTVEKLKEVLPDANFDRQFTLFGEACGPGIQKNGGTYSKTKTFVLFDVKAGNFWLEPNDISDVALKLGIQEAPYMGYLTLPEINSLVKNGFRSPLSRLNTGTERYAEGIIARTVPGLLTRYGTRLVFKLKTEDFGKTQLKELEKALVAHG